MKNICFCMLALVSLNTNGQQKNSEAFVLNGHFTNQQNGMVYLSYESVDGKYKRDSTVIEKGSFRFTGSINEPTMVYLNGKTQTRSMSDPNYTNFFIEPGQTDIMLADGAYKEAKISGSTVQDEMEELMAQKRKVEQRWARVLDTLHAINQRSNTQYQETKDWALEPYFQEMKEITDRFIQTHPASYVTAYQLRSNRGMSDQALQNIYNGFPLKVQQSSYGKAILEELDKRKIGVPGTMAAAFSTKDIDGKMISLSDFKGKYVLIDFWASWCVPCRKGNPHLRELYAKYKDKGFEVIGVSDDDRKPDAWRNAVKKDQLPWKQVLRGMKMTVDGDNISIDRTNDISAGYNISSLPTQILIDPSGKIIGRYGGDGGEIHDVLDGKLAELFKL